jgi:hypothetical protein
MHESSEQPLIYGGLDLAHLCYIVSFVDGLQRVKQVGEIADGNDCGSTCWGAQTC